MFLISSTHNYFETANCKTFHIKWHGHLSIRIFLGEVGHHFLIYRVAMLARPVRDVRKPHNFTWFRLNHFGKGKEQVFIRLCVLDDAFFVIERAKLHPDFGRFLRHFLVLRRIFLWYCEDKTVYILCLCHDFLDSLQMDKKLASELHVVPTERLELSLAAS